MQAEQTVVTQGHHVPCTAKSWLVPPAQEGRSLVLCTSGTKADLGQCLTGSVLPSKVPCSHIKMQKQQQHRQNKAVLPPIASQS